MLCRFMIGLAAAIIAAPALAEAEDTAPPDSYLMQDPPWWFHPVLTLSAGGTRIKIGNTQTLGMSGDFSTYHYASDEAYHTQPLIGLFAGTEIPLRRHWALQTGLAFYQPSHSILSKGILTQGVDAPSSNQYPYGYEVVSRQLLLETKLFAHMNKRVHPYVSLGLGMAFNQAYNYDVVIPPFTTFTPQFRRLGKTNFSYSVGAGVDMKINSTWRLGVGYRFASLGSANLGPGLLDVIPFPGALTQSHLYAQEVVAHLTYQIS